MNNRKGIILLGVGVLIIVSIFLYLIIKPADQRELDKYKSETTEQDNVPKELQGKEKSKDKDRISKENFSDSTDIDMPTKGQINSDKYINDLEKEHKNGSEIGSYLYNYYNPSTLNEDDKAKSRERDYWLSLAESTANGDIKSIDDVYDPVLESLDESLFDYQAKGEYVLNDVAYDDIALTLIHGEDNYFLKLDYKAMPLYETKTLNQFSKMVRPFKLDKKPLTFLDSKNTDEFMDDSMNDYSSTFNKSKENTGFNFNLTNEEVESNKKIVKGQYTSLTARKKLTKDEYRDLAVNDNVTLTLGGNKIKFSKINN